MLSVVQGWVHPLAPGRGVQPHTQSELGFFRPREPRRLYPLWVQLWVQSSRSPLQIVLRGALSLAADRVERHILKLVEPPEKTPHGARPSRPSAASAALWRAIGTEYALQHFGELLRGLSGVGAFPVPLSLVVEARSNELRVHRLRVRGGKACDIEVPAGTLGQLQEECHLATGIAVAVAEEEASSMSLLKSGGRRSYR